MLSVLIWAFTLTLWFTHHLDEDWAISILLICSFGEVLLDYLVAKYAKRSYF